MPEDLLRFWLYLKRFSYEALEEYTMEFRTKVVQRALRVDHQRDTAEFFNLSPGTVGQFVKSYKTANRL